MSTHPPTWQAAGLSDIGQVRSSNQDAYLIRNERLLWVVADGMGGHAGGDIASRLTIEAFVHELARQPSRESPAEHERFLRAATEDANTRIQTEGDRNPELRSMGTTLVAVSLADAQEPVAHILHVGDSRAYLYREGQLQQLTQDHSVVEDFVRRGLLTHEQAAVHPKRHALTRAVGIDRIVEPDYAPTPLHPGDLLLLCTDGLTKMLSDGEIATCLSEHGLDPARCCQILVQESNRRGGQDNVTVIVAAPVP